MTTRGKVRWELGANSGPIFAATGTDLRASAAVAEASCSMTESAAAPLEGSRASRAPWLLLGNTLRTTIASEILKRRY